MMDSSANRQPAHAPARIELVWPGKGLTPVRDADGGWHLREPSSVRAKHWLRQDERIAPTSAASYRDSVIVVGERLPAMATLRTMIGRRVKVAYLDLPRVVVDDKTRAFHGEEDKTWSTFLTVVYEHVANVMQLIARDGVAIVHCGQDEEPYVSLVLGELFGQQNHVGTIVWQRSYAPRNAENMKELTATHDPILIYAVDKEALPRVALTREPQGYANPDNDPRGLWRAVRQKGSATWRERTDFDPNLPPYRWELVHGSLPPGLWRVSPLTGVVWGTPTKPGKFVFTVEVTDSKGQKAKSQVSITVRPQGAYERPAVVPWLFDKKGPPADEHHGEWTGVQTRKGLPTIETTKLPDAVVGSPYSGIVLAAGGSPYTGKKRPTPPRCWEFTWGRLVDEILLDKVDFGDDGKAVARLRKHLTEEGELEYANQQTWWPGSVVKKSDHSTGEDEGVGFTENATKHLESLRHRGVISQSVKTAKPELLLARLLQIFSRPDDLVMELFGESADASTVAVKLGRRFVLLAGHTDQERELFEACALPRLKGVVNGCDAAERPDAENDDEQIGRQSTAESSKAGKRKAFIGYGGGGAIRVMSLQAPFAEKFAGEEYPRFTANCPRKTMELRAAILTSEGFLLEEQGSAVHGVSVDGRIAAFVLGADEFLDNMRVADIWSSVEGRYDKLVIHYFRSTESFDGQHMAAEVVCKRVPMYLAF